VREGTDGEISVSGLDGVCQDPIVADNRAKGFFMADVDGAVVQGNRFDSVSVNAGNALVAFIDNRMRLDGPLDLRAVTELRDNRILVDTPNDSPIVTNNFANNCDIIRGNGFVKDGDIGGFATISISEQNNDMVIAGNVFDVGTNEGVRISNCDRLHFVGNVLQGGRTLIDIDDAQDALIAANTALATSLRGANIRSNTSGIRMVGNQFDNFVDNGTGNDVFQTMKAPALDSGQTTLSSGNTSVTVSYNVNADFAVGPEDIMITPTTGLGSASSWHITNVGSGGFDIVVDTDPGQDLGFAWTLQTQRK